MDLVTTFIVVLIALSLLGAVAGQWWGLAFPVGAGLLGIVLFAGGEPTGPAGGDADPQRLTGGALMIIAVPWAVAYAVVAVARRRLPRR
jgi:hypothetical protein